MLLDILYWTARKLVIAPAVELNICAQDARRRQTAEYAGTSRRSGERPWYSPQQSPHVSPRGSFASLDRRLLGLAVAVGDTAEFPILPPERSLVKATIIWRHSGQVITGTAGMTSRFVVTFNICHVQCVSESRLTCRAVQEVFVKGSYDQWQSQRPLERTDWEGQPWSIVAYLPPGIYQAGPSSAKLPTANV